MPSVDNYRFPCEDDSTFKLDYSGMFEWTNCAGYLEQIISQGYADTYIRMAVTDVDVCSLALRFNAFAVEAILTRHFGAACD